MMDSMLAAVHVVYPGAKDTGRNKVAKMRLSLRLDSKARGWRILCCIRLTSNAASVDAAASEWQVYFDRCPKAARWTQGYGYR